MELFLQTDHRGQFLPRLLKYLQSEIDAQMKQTEDEDPLYLGFESFYAYILTKDIPSFACVEQEFDVAITLDIDIEVYQKKQPQGLADLSAVVDWFLVNFPGDMVLLSDTSELMVLRRRGKIMKKELLQ